jgi:GDSL-like Lipase/Acylhydrolase family
MRERRLPNRGLRVALAIAACTVVAGAAAHATAATPPANDDTPHSIVQLGDSVASGEGTLYGYTYDTKSREWTGGDLDAAWPGPYPRCHDSPDAYGAHVAAELGATFTQFACSGATFTDGIAAAQVSDGEQDRPAQFGNWDTKAELNAAYDAAQPDLVLVTFGADDTQFHAIVQSCIENGYESSFHVADLQCVAGNPGPTIQSDFVDALPQLQQHYRALAQWTAARAAADHVPRPRVIFTTYPDPLPPKGAKCPDSSWLYPKQTRYLSSLVRRTNRTIRATVAAIDDPKVSVADVANAYVPNGQDHRWCSKDPWAYGLSILHVYEPSSFDSQAPFHPTPEGQASIAAIVLRAVRGT